ncbi:MAG: hypothetical protein MUP97_11710 [Acidimicrobiia bacterium]|nr:hypothetical protein [Acidimicrobiia bacterium]
MCAALAVMFAVTGFVALRLAGIGPNPSTFVVATTSWVDVDKAPASLYVDPRTSGYDGVFFYRLALDPATTERTDFGVTLDLPALRQARIIYPSVAHLLAVGSPDLVPLMLIVVNILALGLLAWALAQLARDAGRAPIAGAALALGPGLLFSLSRDLCEPLAIALVACAILAATRGRLIACGALLIGAVLTRETMAIWALGVSVAAVVDARRAVPWGRVAARVAAGGVPLALLLAWQFVVESIWGQTPLAAGQRNLGYPFVGLVESMRHDFDTLATGMWSPGLPDVAFAVVVGVLLVITAVAYPRSRAPLEVKCGLVLGVVLVVCQSGTMWETWAGFLRTASDLLVFGGLVVALAPSARLRQLTWLWPLSSLPLAGYLVLRP